MKGLAKLHPFIRICQLSGFIPFRMEIDPLTKKFQGLAFSCLLGWWSAFLKMISLAGVIFIIMWDIVPKSLVARGEQASLKTFCFQCMGVSQVISVFMIQLTALRSNHIRKAMELIQEADDILESVANSAVPEDTIVRRTFIGAVLTVSFVCFNQSAFSP